MNPINLTDNNHKTLCPYVWQARGDDVSICEQQFQKGGKIYCLR